MAPSPPTRPTRLDTFRRGGDSLFEMDRKITRAPITVHPAAPWLAQIEC
jgi:hypothetical protein